MSARNDLPPASAAVSHPAATTRHLSVVPGEGDTAKKAKKPGIDDNPSEEVVALCTLLADLYHELGNTRPNPNQKGWYRACRLLLTKDGPDKKGWTPKQVETIMRWALADPFWQNNIQSMPTLREKFDRLRGRRNETITKGQTKPVGSRAQTDHDRIQAYRQELKDKVTT